MKKTNCFRLRVFSLSITTFTNIYLNQLHNHYLDSVLQETS